MEFSPAAGAGEDDTAFSIILLAQTSTREKTNPSIVFLGSDNKGPDTVVHTILKIKKKKKFYSANHEKSVNASSTRVRSDFGGDSLPKMKQIRSDFQLTGHFSARGSVKITGL